MIRRPPRSTRTDTLFPYTTLFRSIATTVIAGAALAILLWPHTPPSSAQGEAPPTPRPVVRATSEPARAPAHAGVTDRKSVVYGKSVSVRVDLGGRRIIKKKKTKENDESITQINQPY